MRCFNSNFATSCTPSSGDNVTTSRVITSAAFIGCSPPLQITRIAARPEICLDLNQANPDRARRKTHWLALDCSGFDADQGAPSPRPDLPSSFFQGTEAGDVSRKRE